MDFLLSLSPKAKDKLASTTKLNNSVMYQEHVLGEEDVSSFGFAKVVNAGSRHELLYVYICC
jgi:hypothetical protein